jgi:hypothetical protein
MDIDGLVEECKNGLGISPDSFVFDGLLIQKIKAIQSYMKNAGVSDTKMNDDLAVGVIVMGVADIWEIQGGTAKFSPIFHNLLTQLTFDDVVTP